MYSNYCNLAFVSSGPSNRKVGRVIPSFRTAEDEKSPVLSRNTALKENEHPNPRENECLCVCVCVCVCVSDGVEKAHVWWVCMCM